MLTDEVRDTGLRDDCYPMAWDATATGIYCSTYDQGADQSALTHFDIASQTTQTIQSAVPGEIVDIANGGDSLLVVRQLTGGGKRLVRQQFSDGNELTVFEPAANLGGRFLNSVNNIVVFHDQLRSVFARIQPNGVELTPIQVDSDLDFYPE